jgi:hypothetical protein
MATRADSDAETNVVGHQLGVLPSLRRAGGGHRDPQDLVCHGGRDGPRGGTDQEPAGAAANCGVSHACSADRRPLSGYASQPSLAGPWAVLHMARDTA